MRCFFFFFPPPHSDRDELSSRKQQHSRENMISMGNELRKSVSSACFRYSNPIAAFGAGVLGERAVARMKPNEDYVIDSVRHPLEVAAMRNSGRFFRLIAVDAPPEIRFERLRARHRAGDANTLEEFLRVEHLENNHPDPAGQQLDQVMELADLRIDNSSTEAAFIASVEALLNKIDIDSQHSLS